MEKDIFESKIFKTVILSIGGLIVLTLIFGLGVFVGSKRAEFSFQWSRSYQDNFVGATDANGVVGQVIETYAPIDSSQETMVVRGADNLEKSIVVGSKTAIVKQKQNVKFSDLDIDDNVVIIGRPNGKGQIEASLIRILP